MKRAFVSLTVVAAVLFGYVSTASADEIVVEHHEPERRVVVVKHPRHRRHVVVKEERHDEVVIHR